MARDGKRNPECMHQKIMVALFGKKAAADILSDWHLWPDPQRAIYSRLLQNKYVLVPGDEYKKIKYGVKLLSETVSEAQSRLTTVSVALDDLSNTINSWNPNSRS